MDWLDFVDVMMVDEKSSSTKYEMVAKIATDPQIKEIFKKLAYEEGVHLAVLQKFRKDIQSASPKS